MLTGHNGRVFTKRSMPSPSPATRPGSGRTTTAVVLAAGLLLSACSSDADQPAAAPTETPTSATATTESPSPSATGPDLTDPGSQLAFGDTATVDYKADKKNALLDLTVKSAEQGALGDFSGFDTQDPLVRSANFYYVRVQVKNVGRKPFGNAEVPLWGISGTDTLLPPVKFTSAFEKCPTEALPEKFAKGDTFSTCLVFLSPKKGSLEGVSYRPTVDYTPIEWHGKVEKLQKKKQQQPKGKKKPRSS